MRGPDFLINATPDGKQWNPSVAMDAAGNFVVAWNGASLNDNDGVSARRFQVDRGVPGDIDGDGKADILWRNLATDGTIIWSMDGSLKLFADSLDAPPLVWQIEQVRDYNGDGMFDILWRSASTDNTVIWQMNGSSRTAAGSLGIVDPAWQPQ